MHLVYIYEYLGEFKEHHKSAEMNPLGLVNLILEVSLKPFNNSFLLLSFCDL